MNERIRKLAEQAGIDLGNGQSYKIENFAELIVEDCAYLFKIEWGEEKLTGNDVGYVLKKHFGVEQ
jgi:hypothetical protein